jgi:hypothetical protein
MTLCETERHEDLSGFSCRPVRLNVSADDGIRETPGR